MTPQELLRHHVTGAIERGEKEAVVEQPTPTRKERSLYFVEMTDTYGGEANYCWVNRFLVKAKSFQGAISKVVRKTGIHARLKYNSGDFAQYRCPGHCITYFVNWSDEGREANQYSRIELL